MIGREGDRHRAGGRETQGGRERQREIQGRREIPRLVDMEIRDRELSADVDVLYPGHAVFS